MKKIINYLIYLFIFLLPWQTRWIYKQGQINGKNWEYGTFAVYATEAILALIFILASAYLVKEIRKQKNKKTKKQKSQNALYALLIIAGFCASCYLAISPAIAFYKLTYLIAGAAFCLVLVAIKPNFEKISLAIIFSGIIQSGIAIQQFATQKVIASKYLGMAAQDPQTLGTPVVNFNGTRFLRAFGSLPHPNILAGFLLISILLIIGLIVISKNKKLHKLLPLAFVVNFIGLLTTLSRAALLAFLVSIIFMAFWTRKDKIFSRAVTKFALIAMLIIILFTVSFPGLIATRAFGTDRLENISNQTRLEQYSKFTGLIKDYWIFGAGLGNYTLASYLNNPGLNGFAYQPIHNTYLLIFTELGLLGAMLLLTFVFYLYYSISRFKNWSNQQIISFSCLVALCVIALFDHYLWSFYFGIILTVLVLIFTVKTNKS